MRGLALSAFILLLAMVVGAIIVLAVLLHRRSQERDRLARQDPLTSLGNRFVLAEATERLLRGIGERDGDGSHGPALLLVDLDGFKDVNDTLGHAAGDTVLIQVARQLVAAAGDDALVTRLGGDEFAILLPGSQSLASAIIRAKRILGGLDVGDFHADGVALDVNASIGVAVAPRHGRTLSDLLKHADVAMYDAKGARAGVAAYDPSRDPHSTNRLATLAKLREAMDEGQLHLRYQPVVRAEDGELLGFEALLRWDHPERGLLLPAEFIPLAERTSLIHALTRWVLLTAVRQASAWHKAGLDLTMAVNISPVSLEDGLLGIVEEVLALNRWPAHRLVLEVTESAVTEDPARAQRVVSALRDRGVQVAVDDFGAGFTSLSQLRGLPVQQLKIDRQFVSDLSDGLDEDDTIISSIINLGHRLGMSVVAEGVETAGAAARLAELKCDELQGYLFARPLKALEVQPWIARHRATNEAIGVARGTAEVTAG